MPRSVRPTSRAALPRASPWPRPAAAGLSRPARIDRPPHGTPTAGDPTALERLQQFVDRLRASGGGDEPADIYDSYRAQRSGVYKEGFEARARAR